MKFLPKIIDKLYLKQWSIGIAAASIEDIIVNKKMEADFTWIPISSNHEFFADPFLFKSDNGGLSILYEQYDYREQYGKISLFTLDKNFRVLQSKIIRDTQSHLSYPFIFFHNSELLVFPEACKSGKLSGYQFDPESRELIFKGDLIDLPLVDSTILNFNNKYWIFCTMEGKDSDNRLYLFYSDHLFGPYMPHKQNPIKNSLNSSRPAGHFIEVGGTLYRPAQNSEKYYGASITINKVLQLDEDRYLEEFYMEIAPDKNSRFCSGIHTLNHVDNWIVVDGLSRKFLPREHVATFFRKNIRKIIKQLPGRREVLPKNRKRNG